MLSVSIAKEEDPSRIEMSQYFVDQTKPRETICPSTEISNQVLGEREFLRSPSASSRSPFSRDFYRVTCFKT